MGWETRGKQRYYYKSTRIDGQPRKIYLGTGSVGRAHEIMDRQLAREKKRNPAEQARHRHYLREGDRLWSETWTWLSLLAEAHLHLEGWYRHRGQWRKAKRKARTRQSRVPIPVNLERASLQEHLKVLNARSNAADPDADEELQAFLEEHPEIWEAVGDLNRAALMLWAGYLDVLFIRSEPDPDSTPLERLLVDAIRAAEANLKHAEFLITETGSSSGLAITTRYMRVERADNRLWEVKRLLTRVGGNMEGQTEGASPATDVESEPPIDGGRDLKSA